MKAIQGIVRGEAILTGDASEGIDIGLNVCLIHGYIT